MIEKVKSVVLFLLVCTSIYLTYQLWYGREPVEPMAEETFERIVVEQPRPFERVILPASIVVSQEEGFYVLQEGNPDFERFWDIISRALRHKGTVSGEADTSLSPGEFQECLTAFFRPALPVGADSPWLSELPAATVVKVELYCQAETRGLLIYQPGADSGLGMNLSGIISEKLNDLLSSFNAERQTVFQPLSDDMLAEHFDREILIRAPVYVPAAPVYLDRLLLEPESIDRQMLLKTFFVDYSLARIIEERDGGVMYTDGERGLRLKTTGIEYSNPKLEEGLNTTDYYETLAAGNNLLSYHGGWPEHLRLDGLAVLGWGRTSVNSVSWMMYYQGWPVFREKPTMLIYNDSGLIRYSRSLFQVIETVAGRESSGNAREIDPVSEWQEVLYIAAQLVDRQSPADKPILRLETMVLGYIVTETNGLFVGEPVWYINLNGERLYFRADDLSLLDREEML